jgi:hypothetical protein
VTADGSWRGPRELGGIAFDPSERLLLTAGGVLAVAFDAAGQASTPLELASFGAVRATGIAGRDDGSVAVALPGAGAIAVLDTTGAPLGRALGAPLERPVAVAIAGGRVLVADRAGVLSLAW